MRSTPSQSSIGLPSLQSDVARIYAFRNGNTRALDDFYLLHRREFIKWAERTFGLDSAEAVDVYQDAIIILYENINRGKLSNLNASLKTYFFGIGKNLILKKLSRERSEKRRWETIYRYADPTESELLSEHEEDKLEAVSAGLQGLSERNQSILKLYYYQHLPLKDIAEQLGYESVDVVKNQKVRCMKYLRKLVEEKLIAC
jgi:RNA polymerase sigma factor (sigma-70 family)